MRGNAGNAASWLKFTTNGQTVANDIVLGATGAGLHNIMVATPLSTLVTLTGNLQYAIQRSPLVKAVARVAGVTRVIDQLQLVERKPG